MSLPSCGRAPVTTEPWTSISQHSQTDSPSVRFPYAHMVLLCNAGFCFVILLKEITVRLSVKCGCNGSHGHRLRNLFFSMFPSTLLLLQNNLAGLTWNGNGVLPLLYFPLVSSLSLFCGLTDYVLAQVSSATPLEGKTESGWSQQPKLLPLGVQEASLHQCHSHPEQKSRTYSRLLTQAQLDCLSFAKHMGIKVLRE